MRAVSQVAAQSSARRRLVDPATMARSVCCGDDVDAVVAVTPVAASGPDTLAYVLPAEGAYPIWPEGVAVHGDEYYVTSFCDGRVFRGNLRESQAEVFVPGGNPETTGSAGIKATDTRLVVAGMVDLLGGVRVFDRATGALVARFSNDLPFFESTNVNDVAIAPNGDAYVTDSIWPVVYRIPAEGLRHYQAAVQPLPVFHSFEGTPFAYVPDSVNADGIVITPRRSLPAHRELRDRAAVPGPAERQAGHRGRPWRRQPQRRGRHGAAWSDAVGSPVLGPRGRKTALERTVHLGTATVRDQRPDVRVADDCGDRPRAAPRGQQSVRWSR